MNNLPTATIAALLYFGAFLIPFFYLAFTMFNGPKAKAMYWSMALQTCGSLLVCGYVYYLSRTGNPDYYKAWALLMPVNFMSLLYYLGVLLMPGKNTPAKRL